MSEFTFDPNRGFPKAAPLLLYEDVDCAVDWLSRVFGFGELVRVVCVGNWIAHAEIECEGGIVLLDAARGDYSPRKDYRKPSADGHVCAYAHMMVSDVDSHFERAKAEGATIILEPKDQEWGLRQYTARDYEGHVWEFCQFIKDIPPEEWEATTAFAGGAFPGAN
jgi:uncharacterized glyoxalase superfamily protein PhnB